MHLRVTGGGRHPARVGEVENDVGDVLSDQIVFLISTKENVSSEWIQPSTRELAQAELDDENFYASDKLLARFMTRYDLSLRWTTNLTVLSDDELTARAVRFLTYLSSRKSSRNPNDTLLMDETAVFFEDLRRDTVDYKDSRHVDLRSTGFALMRITDAITFTAMGTKLPPLLIWKSAIK